MERNESRYMVVVYTKRLPESFKGPVVLRNLLSVLSESPNTEIGGGRGMPLKKAEEIAANRTYTSYVDGQNHLRSSKGVVFRVR